MRPGAHMIFFQAENITFLGVIRITKGIWDECWWKKKILIVQGPSFALRILLGPSPLNYLVIHSMCHVLYRHLYLTTLL